MPTGRQISKREFLRLWNDDTITTDEIAAKLGVYRSSVSRMGQSRGLPPRKLGPKPKVDEARFTELWLAGVTTGEIAREMRMARNYPGVLAQRLNLASRRQGQRGISMADYRAMRLREALAASAKREQAALANAEMVDNTSHHAARFAARRAA